MLSKSIGLALLILILPYPLLGYVTYSVEKFETMERRIQAASVSISESVRQ